MHAGQKQYALRPSIWRHAKTNKQTKWNSNQYFGPVVKNLKIIDRKLLPEMYNSVVVVTVSLFFSTSLSMCTY
jgi:hypothetical protein